MTPGKYAQLKADIEAEVLKLPNVLKIRIVKEEEERLGAERGSIFVEFRDRKSAELAIKKFRGRQFDGNETKVAYVEERTFREDIALP